MIKHIKILFLIILASSCEDILDTEVPANEIPAEQAIQTQEDLQDLLNSTYDVVANYNDGLKQRLGEILSDNIDGSNIEGFLLEVYNHNTNIFNEDVENFYRQPYFAIHRANLLMENLGLVNLTEEEENQFLAEARFIRGICHFDAVNYMAHPPGFTTDNSHLGVPIRLATGADPVNRSSVNDTYDAIISDLRYAENNLPDNNGVYATRFAAQGYLAKVYFMEQNYDSAIYYVDQVLGNGSPFGLTNNINARYSQSITSEHIFYTLSNNSGDDNRSDVFISSFRSDLQDPPFRVSQEVFDAATANASDTRADWFEMRTREDGSNFYVTTKFNSNFFNVALIHVVDLLLIRAEAKALLNQNLDEAIDDINSVRNRAGLTDISPVSNRQQILDAAQSERRIEMSLEGDRILQIKRRGAAGEETAVRGDAWDCNGMILIFPNEEQFNGFVNNESGGC